MNKPGLWNIASIVAVFCLATTIALGAQTFTPLASFDGKNGFLANGPLVQGANGNFYGTTAYGGAHNNNTSCSGGGCGTFFEITPAGKLTTLYNFCSQKNCADGATPSALVLGTNGNFYGTTDAGGGINNSSFCPYGGCGTVFEITPAGTLTTLYNFCAEQNCADGVSPSRLVQATNGSFYGVAAAGGIDNGDAGCPLGCGTVFRITPKGALTIVYSFCTQTNCADGETPQAGLVQATNGNFYGVTFYGGTGWGNVFEVTAGGRLTSLHSFCPHYPDCGDGIFPQGQLIQASNGKLYGTTSVFGANNGGTVFEITPAGKLKTLYNFCSQTNCADGGRPFAGLVEGTDGNFYGTTSLGGIDNSGLCGTSGCGTAFAITAAGSLSTLYSFCSDTNCTDGAFPETALMQGTKGIFYGSAVKGGADFQGCTAQGGCGDVFGLSVGLGPFVETNPGSGKVGRAVTILGNNLTGATGVSFNGTAATFTIVSGTEIKTTVPTGATTGVVEVTTPKKALKSNAVFRVTK
jgi:uncharacterized repeat protein (TIGR03803 family)